MHIYRASDAERFEPPGHYGNLELSTIVAGEAQAVGFGVQFSFCPPGGGGHLHSHAAEDQLFVVVDGELTFDTGEQRFTLYQREAVLFLAGEPHFTVNEGARDSLSVVVTVPVR